MLGLCEKLLENVSVTASVTLFDMAIFSFLRCHFTEGLFLIVTLIRDLVKSQTVSVHAIHFLKTDI